MKCVYFNDNIRCYENGDIQRLFRGLYWRNVLSKPTKTGYYDIGVNGKMIFQHRIIAYCFLGLKNIKGIQGGGEVVDHIDGDKLNNDVFNLRIVTHQQNTYNQPNAKGYTYRKKLKKYESKIKSNGRTIYIGLYDTEEDARNAYLKTKEIYHKF